MGSPLRIRPVVWGLGLVGLGVLGILFAGRVLDDVSVSDRVVWLTGEYRGTYAGDCVARLLLRSDGVAEYRDGCGGELELRAAGTWIVRGRVVRFAWRDEPPEWTRQKRRARISRVDGRPALELDFVRLAQLRRLGP